VPERLLIKLPARTTKEKIVQNPDLSTNYTIISITVGNAAITNSGVKMPECTFRK